MAKWLILSILFFIFSGCGKSIDLSYTKPPPILKQSKKLDIRVIGDNKEVLPSLLNEMHNYNASHGDYFKFGNDIKVTVSSKLSRHNTSSLDQSRESFCSDYYWNGSQDVCLRTQNLTRKCVTSNAIETATVDVVDIETRNSFSFVVDGSNSNTVCGQNTQGVSNRYILASEHIKGAYYEFGGKKYVLSRSYNVLDGNHYSSPAIVAADLPTDQVVKKIVKKLTPSIEEYSVSLFDEPNDSWPKDIKSLFSEMIEALDNKQYVKAQELITQLEKFNFIRQSFAVIYNKAVLAEAEGNLDSALYEYERAGKASADMKNILASVDSISRIKMLQKNRIQEGKARE